MQIIGIFSTEISINSSLTPFFCCYVFSFFFGLFGSSLTGFTPTSDAKQLEYYEERSSKLPKINNQSTNKGNLRGTLSAEPASDVFRAVDGTVDKSNDSLAAAENHSESFPADASRHDFSIVAGLDEDTIEHQVPARSGSSPKTDIVSSTLETKTIESVPAKEEVCFCVCLPCFCCFFLFRYQVGFGGCCYAVGLLDP